MAFFTEYTWMVVTGGLGCFILAFGIGANDVANNFGSSVGSKAIKLKYAILLAAVFEFIGAVALGSSVTDAVRKGVIDFTFFMDRPDILLLLNMSAIVASATWLLLASGYGVPVSTTHSVIGSLIGAGLATGKVAVNWEFVGTVVASWFVSPILAALCGGTVFLLTRAAILRRSNPVQIGMRITWLLILVVCLVFVAFFVLKNPLVLERACGQLQSDGSVLMASPCYVKKWVAAHTGAAVGIICGCAVGLTFFISPPAYYYVVRMLSKHDVAQQAAAEVTTCRIDSNGSDKLVIGTGDRIINVSPDVESISSHDTLNIDVDDIPLTCDDKIRQHWTRMPWNQDLHKEAMVDEATQDIHNNAEKFDPRAECYFSFLQIISAIVSCLVHGANDVANATAPFATIIDVWRSGEFNAKVQCPVWILVMGGAGIALGLAIMGSAVIVNIGIKLTKITPSRGFSIETGMGMIMVIGSVMGLPLSTTHCQVGSTIGVGLLDHPEDFKKKRSNCYLFNWHAIHSKLILRIVTSWIVTMLFTGVLSAGIFSFAYYAPSPLRQT